MARARRVVPVSALEALARAAINPNAPIAAWMDAHRREVFSQVYAPDGRDVLENARSSQPSALLDAWVTDAGRTPVFIGDGAVRYRAEITARFSDARVLPPPPLAALIGQIAAGGLDRAVLPHAVVPIYIRRPDAELARSRRTTEG
jgi:tRNA A37 threonylcarbamoyladenosine modification protein TsaB